MTVSQKISSRSASTSTTMAPHYRGCKIVPFTPIHSRYYEDLRHNANLHLTGPPCFLFEITLLHNRGYILAQIPSTTVDTYLLRYSMSLSNFIMLNFESAETPGTTLSMEPASLPTSGRVFHPREDHWTASDHVVSPLPWV